MNEIELPPNVVLEATASILNARGWVTDECGTGITSCYIELENSIIEGHLREHGYEGEELQSHGRYCDSKGATYALYDSGLVSYEEIDLLLAIECRPNVFQTSKSN